MRVLLLCHEALVPPQKNINEKRADLAPWRTEYSVMSALRRNGHIVECCGIGESLDPLKLVLQTSKIDVVFNLLEEFSGEGLLEPVVVSFLEGEHVPVTGCRSIGLILAKNKLAAKTILRAAKVPVPGDLKYPKIVKLIDEESSMGITAQSVVRSAREERVQTERLKRKYHDRLLIEEFIPGRELHVAILQTPQQLFVSEIWETSFGALKGPQIISEKVKWDFAYRDKIGVQLKAADNLPAPLKLRLQTLAQASFTALEMTGYARVDIRLTPEGRPFILEVNPNPDITCGDEFAECMSSIGLNYDELIDKILLSAQ